MKPHSSKHDATNIIFPCTGYLELSPLLEYYGHIRFRLAEYKFCPSNPMNEATLPEILPGKLRKPALPMWNPLYPVKPKTRVMDSWLFFNSGKRFHRAPVSGQEGDQHSNIHGTPEPLALGQMKVSKGQSQPEIGAAFDSPEGGFEEGWVPTLSY